MAELVDVLGGLGGPAAQLSKGQVTAVSTGALTIQVNGGTFTNVPYLKGSWAPAVNDIVYLLNQSGFGMICLGSPVTSSAATPWPAPTILTVTPSTVANWQISTTYPAGAWSVPGDGTLVQAKGNQSSGAWFYAASDLSAWGSTKLGKVEMQLDVASGTPQLSLHRNASPVGTLDSYAGPLTVSQTAGTTAWVSLPLSYGYDLLSGAAKGLVATSQSFDALMPASGTIRLTSL